MKYQLLDYNQPLNEDYTILEVNSELQKWKEPDYNEKVTTCVCLCVAKNAIPKEYAVIIVWDSDLENKTFDILQDIESDPDKASFDEVLIQNYAAVEKAFADILKG